MIAGYNHNVKYKDRIFHVQTEDSGKKNPHIITLLYYGGNILESVKSSYQDKLSLSDIDEQLANIMQKQHKNVLQGLIVGRYDDKIEQRAANASFLNGPAPLNVAEGSQQKSSFGMGGGVRPAAKAPATPAPAALAMAPAAPAPSAPAAAGEGLFSTEGSMLDAIGKATQTLDAEDLLRALESGDDFYVFGASNDEKKLDDMMLDFLKGG